jgi:hypothetical protein
MSPTGPSLRELASTGVSLAVRALDADPLDR